MRQKRGEWEVLSSKIVHKNPYYQVREDSVIKPNGSKGFYNVVETKGAVFIAAVDKVQNVYLEELYRYTNDKYSLEMSAGGTDGEDPLTAAKREPHEEAGLAATNWKELSIMYPANGILSEDNHVYIATDLRQNKDNAQKEEGITRIIKVPHQKVFQMVKSGETTDAQTIACLMKAALELEWFIPNL